ncbi:hypothetical protein HanRHA438_Chr13g0592111 [Helianthus annuus]|nr:hypothetical protein HanRHA438_Chr13g0592111 [Helianthus annuus]
MLIFSFLGVQSKKFVKFGGLLLNFGVIFEIFGKFVDSLQKFLLTD